MKVVLWLNYAAVLIMHMRFLQFYLFSRNEWLSHLDRLCHRAINLHERNTSR